MLKLQLKKYLNIAVSFDTANLHYKNLGGRHVAIYSQF